MTKLEYRNCRANQQFLYFYRSLFYRWVLWLRIVGNLQTVATLNFILSVINQSFLNYNYYTLNNLKSCNFCVASQNLYF